MSKIEFIKDYRDNETLRKSFNELAKKTFWIDFEDWYQNGYWTDKYNPHSVVVDGKVVANVSVNLTDFVWKEEVRHFIQLGTVMTDEAYRNRGFIRRIMEEIDREYAADADGIYLFANNDVLEFYPKFGFRTAVQYEYFKEIKDRNEATMVKVPMQDKAAWDKIEAAIRDCVSCSSFEMINNSELNMFYVSKYLQDCVYYNRELDTYVIAEAEGEELTIDMVISKTPQDLNRIASSFGNEIHKVILGFTPKDTTGFQIRELNQDDRTLHIKGKGFEDFSKDKLMFPLLAHA